MQASLEVVPTSSPPEFASRDHGKVMWTVGPFKGLVVMNGSRQGLYLRAASGRVDG